MIKYRLKISIENCLKDVCRRADLGSFNVLDLPVVIERPRIAEHGDFACGIALKLASRVKIAPLKIAEVICQTLRESLSDFAEVETAAPGYINFKISTDFLQDTLKEIHLKGADFGRLALGAKKTALIEYASANPPGDVSLGHARTAIYGNCLGNLLRFAGYKVDEGSYANAAAANNEKFDAACYLDKFRRAYDILINVWSADHQGQVASLKAALKALGEDSDKLEIILTQNVNLSNDEQFSPASKQMGRLVYLEDLINELGKDSLRYYLIESSPQNSINLDLKQAKEAGRENPSFYIQYAHARCCATLRRALEPVFDFETKLEELPLLTQEKWAGCLAEYKNNASLFSALFDESLDAYECQKKLIMQLASFPEEIEEALMTRQPGRIARFAYELANDLQNFYELCRVFTDDDKCTRARLGLIVASRQVLANALGIIGVTAVERM